MEQIATKVNGTVQAMRAGFKGLRGVFLHLAEEHGEVAALMKRVKKTSDPQVRREYFPHIRAELLSHERAEIAEVYGVLANCGVVLEHKAGALMLETAIADVDAQDITGPEWGACFDRLFALVRAHVAQEESDFFPKAQQVIDEDESQRILQRYQAAKRALILAQ